MFRYMFGKMLGVRNASLDGTVWEIELAWEYYLEKFLTKLDKLIEELES